MRDLALAQAYRRHGFGLGGVLLKQSLYPGELLLRLLDGAGLVLDFGCGEGLLTNLLARSLPRTRFVGVDLDQEKIATAIACRTNPQTTFHAGDFFEHESRGADVVIFNDVLHHLSPERQIRALQHAVNCLSENGVIILKEVNPQDAWDVRHTSFWDTRLYPRDRLRFFPPAEWTARLGALGVRALGAKVVRHPWVASRTLLWYTRRPKLAEFAPALPTANPPTLAAVLVTGATGFIGEWVARELLNSGLNQEAVRVDLVVRERHRVASDLARHPRVRLVVEDLTNPTFTDSLSDNYVAVFHLAAAVDYFGGASVYENNLRATEGLLAACKRLNPGRLVYTSTMGALDRSRADHSIAPLDEQSPSHPTSPYGRAKYAEEELVRNSALNWSIVRIPWCYGPGMAESHHVRNLLNRVRTNALVCRINWPGRVSIVEVRQAASHIVRVATNPRTARETFFLAEDQPVSIGELFSAMGQTVGATKAGSLNLPTWMWQLSRVALRIAPFQLKCLLSDALVVSTNKARQLGIAVSPRNEDFLVPLARYNAHQLTPSRHREPVLVTGAASGIGAALARQLHTAGYLLIAADRNEERLRERCDAYPTARQWIVDLASPTLAENLLTFFPREFPWPGLIINNAGVGWRGNSWDSSVAIANSVMAVNATAPALITNFFLRQSPAPIVVVNIASTAAFQPLPYMAGYAAAKAFILHFSLAVASELRAAQRRDHVLTIVPSGTNTAFQSAAGVATNPNEKLLSPNDVAAIILRCIRKKDSLVLIGARGRAMSLVASILPLSLQARLWERLMRQLR